MGFHDLVFRDFLSGFRAHRPSSEQNNSTPGLLLWSLTYLFWTHIVCCFDFSNNGKVQGGKDNKLHSLLFAITGNLEGLFSKLELLSAFGRSHYQTFILLPSRRDGLQCTITYTYETHTPEISDNRPAKMENQGAGRGFQSPIETIHTHAQEGTKIPLCLFIFLCISPTLMARPRTWTTNLIWLTISNIFWIIFSNKPVRYRSLSPTSREVSEISGNYNLSNLLRWFYKSH